MPLTPITLLSQLDVDEPQGDITPVSMLDDHIRQLKGFIKEFLSVAHEDWGDLKQESQELTFESITGRLDGGKIESGTIDGVSIGDGVLLEKHHGDGQVSERALADGAVTEDKIGNLEVKDKHIESVAGSKITGPIPGVSVPALVEGEVEAKHLKPDTSLLTDLGLFVVRDTTGGNTLAKIGGILTATLEAGTPKTLKFAMANPIIPDTGILAVATDTAAGKVVTNITVDSYRVRNGWSRLIGEGIIQIGTEVATLDQIGITQNATYFVFLFTSAYGAPDAGAAATLYSTLVSEDGTEILRTTDLVIPATMSALPGHYWQFGVGSMVVDGASTSSPFKVFVRTHLIGASAAFSLGAVGRRDALIALMGVSAT